MANQTEIKHLLILNSIFSLLERRKFIRFEYVPFKPNLPKPYDNHLRKKGIVLITQLTIHSHYLYCHFMLMRHIHSLWFDTQFVPLSCQKHTHTHKQSNNNNSISCAFFIFISQNLIRKTKWLIKKLVYIRHMARDWSNCIVYNHRLLSAIMWPSFNIWFGASDFSTHLPTESIFIRLVFLSPAWNAPIPFQMCILVLPFDFLLTKGSGRNSRNSMSNPFDSPTRILLI